MTERGFLIATYCLCGFANLGSLGIQIGVLSGLAPSRAKIIAVIAPSALMFGFLSTCQTATIAGMVRAAFPSLLLDAGADVASQPAPRLLPDGLIPLPSKANPPFPPPLLSVSPVFAAFVLRLTRRASSHSPFSRRCSECALLCCAVIVPR